MMAIRGVDTLNVLNSIDRYCKTKPDCVLSINDNILNGKTRTLNLYDLALTFALGVAEFQHGLNFFRAPLLLVSCSMSPRVMHKNRLFGE